MQLVHFKETHEHHQEFDFHCEHSHLKNMTVTKNFDMDGLEQRSLGVGLREKGSYTAAELGNPKT